MSEIQNFTEMYTEYMEMIREFHPIKQEYSNVEKKFEIFKKEIENFEKAYEDIHKEVEQLILPGHNLCEEKIKLIKEKDAKQKANIDFAKAAVAEVYEKIIQVKDKMNWMEIKFKMLEKYLFPLGHLIPQ